MRSGLVAMLFALSCLPAAAESSPNPNGVLVEGEAVTIYGRAHVRETPDGTYIDIERRGTDKPVAGVIPFGDEHAYPQLSRLEGRRVEITGVVSWNGEPLITMADPDQLRIVGRSG